MAHRLYPLLRPGLHPMAENLDPEDVMEIMDAAFDLIIKSH